MVKKLLYSILLFFVFLINNYGQTSTTQVITATGAGTFIVPCGVSSITVEAWGGGGAGGGTTVDNFRGGGAGAGGAYASSIITVSGGQSISYNVGTGATGAYSAGAAGGDTWFSSNTTLIAKGGNGGAAPNGGSVLGGSGSTTGSIGTITKAGGNGGGGTASQGGAGGVGAFGGGAGGAIRTGSNPGNSGAQPGGGGGGAYVGSTVDRLGGSGGSGQIKITYFVPASTATTTTGVTVCQGGTGNLQATSSSTVITNFFGDWTTNDAVAPILNFESTAANITTCSFAGINRNYNYIYFTVNVSGSYVFKMKDTGSYDGMAYITTADFEAGNCSGGGTWSMGDDDDVTAATEPRITTNLTAGTVYKLISTTYGTASGTYTGSYEWTITPPAGGGINLAQPTVKWYTAASGGTSIGSGLTFNPVGVAGSTLSNSNTPGTTPFYAAYGDACTRTVANFVVTPIVPTTIVGTANSFCIDNTNTITTASVNSGQYVTLDVIKGFTYTFSVGDVFASSSETITILNDTDNSNITPVASVTGTAGASVSNWISTISGRIKIVLSSSTCTNGTTGGALTLTLNATGNTQDSQIASGSGSWIGHVYNAGGAEPTPFTNANYVGYYTAGLTESFNTNFGGEYTCIPVLSNGVQRASVYAEGYAVRYRMQSAKTPGCYVIKITGDDGVRLYVDPAGTTTPTNNVFERWVEQGSTTYNYILVNLTANANLVFDYYENAVGNVAEIEIQPFNTAANTITAPATVNFCSGGDPGVIGGSLQYNDQDVNMASPYINFQWEVSTDNVNFSNVPTNGTSRTYDPDPITNATSSNIVRYYRRVATVNAATVPGFGCTFALSNVVSITTYPVSVGGTLGLITNGTPVAGSSTCHSGALGSTTFTLSGNIGTVTRWESSTDNFATAGIPIANTTSSLTATGLTTTTSYRAVVESNGCTIAYSSVGTIVVTISPTATAATATNCNGFTANWSSVVNATSYVLTIAEDNAFALPVAGYNNINVGNVNSYAATGLTALKTYYYRVIAVSGCGNSAASNIISIEVKAATTTTWNGGWDNGIPNSANVNIVFNSSFNSTVDLVGCSCQVNAGTVNIVGPNVMTLTNALKVSAGTLTFKDKSSLMQTTNVQNTGNIVYERNTTINRFDYTYYSSPVVGQTMFALSPETLGDKFLSYDGANSKWFYENSASVMTVGKGYVIRGPQSYHDTNRVAFLAKFTGVPTNGPVTGENVIAGKSYIVGNPYPSAIKVSDFLAANPFLEGTVKYWTHNTNVSPSGRFYVYSSTDYASSNATGSTAAQSGGVAPNRYIAAGQSILVKVRAGEAPSQITFNNDMRKSDVPGSNSQFFKPGKTSSEAKVWLNFSNTDGVFKQAMIGYVDGATNSYEDLYDGTTANANSYGDFYSIAETKSLTIQGRAYPFATTDVVPLGYKSTLDGSFTIAIDHAEGELENQSVYLEDKVLNIVQDLKEKPYTFTTVKGTFKERFTLKYTNKTLGTGDFESDKNGIIVSVKDKVITVASASENIKSVYVFDVTGKLLYEKNKVDSLSLSIEKLQSGNQVLLVKVVLDNDSETTKKIIF